MTDLQEMMILTDKVMKVEVIFLTMFHILTCC